MATSSPHDWKGPLLSRQARRAQARSDQKISERMRKTARWILWRSVTDEKHPTKRRKIPIDPYTRKPFERGSDWLTDSSRWCDFGTAAAAAVTTDLDLGFVLGDDWVGLDFDNCIVDGTLAPWVADLVDYFRTYTEVSPSGTGIKLFMRATWPEGAKSVYKSPAWEWELYPDRRFFTVTGAALDGEEREVGDRSVQLSRVTTVLESGDLVALCRLRGLFVREDGENVHIRCPWEREHTSANGDTDAALHVRDGKVVGFHCFHSHCAGRTLGDIRAWFGMSHGFQYPLTEAGDAECFAALYADRARYDHRRGRWLVVDDGSGVWVPDSVEWLTQMTVEMARTRQRQALTLKDDEKKRANAWAINGESRKRVTNTLALARSVSSIADSGEHWDEEPFLLGAPNGVVDLRTGEFRKATPADRVTMRVRVAYDLSATCPLWLQTLAGIFAPQGLFNETDSQSMIDFMQRAIGYSITGDCREECCFFAWGGGANGKGTVMNTLSWLFGDYGDDMPYSTLARAERGNGIPNDLAKLAGKRFITCSEANEFQLNEARLKALTGRDPVTARFLHREFFTFIPVGKIWIATNNKPKIVGLDDGIWRRVHLIPFTQSFEGRENRQLKDRLRLELAGILNWVIAGAGMWLREGLHPPGTVRAATAAYRQESNPITPFVEADCITGEGVRVQAAAAFQAYQRYCQRERVELWRQLNSKAFFGAMDQRFEKVEIRERTRRMFYVGVGLKQQGAVDPGDDLP